MIIILIQTGLRLMERPRQLLIRMCLYRQRLLDRKHLKNSTKWRSNKPEQHQFLLQFRSVKSRSNQTHLKQKWKISAPFFQNLISQHIGVLRDPLLETTQTTKRVIHKRGSRSMSPDPQLGITLIWVNMRSRIARKQPSHVWFITQISPVVILHWTSQSQGLAQHPSSLLLRALALELALLHLCIVKRKGSKK